MAHSDCGCGEEHTHSEGTPFSTILALGLMALLIAGVEVYLKLSGSSYPLWLEFALVAVAIFFGYRTLLEGFRALVNLRFQSINLLMLIAVLGAFYLGEYAEGAIVILLFTLAESLESVGVSRSREALDRLVTQLPARVQLKEGSEVSIDSIEPGAVILVKPFQMIPLDGEVVQGNSLVDESPITGEPFPKDKREGDRVFAGSLNRQGPLELRVTAAAGNTEMAKIRKITLEAMDRKAVTQQFIEAFARIYTPAVIALALAWVLGSTFLFGRPFISGFSEALSLLVIACPCALVISTPVSLFAAIGAASKRGAWVKGGRVVEALAGLRLMALDKTRTLTYGEPIVTDVIPYGETTKEELLSCAAGIELFSEHPLAQSIVETAKSQGLKPHPVQNVSSVVGKGIKAECLVCEDSHQCLGKLEFILEEHVVPPEILAEIDALRQQAKNVVVISSQKKLKGIIALEDRLRSDSPALIRTLKEIDVKPVMLTGDHQVSAQAVAAKLGIEAVFSELLPEQKAQELEELKKQYKVVGMFGDGVNDAPALAVADVGLSISSLGSDTAIETASVVLFNQQLESIPWLIRLGRKCRNIIRANIFGALGVKAIVMVLALMGKANLAMAIFADVGMTLLVIANSLRLMRFK